MTSKLTVLVTGGLGFIGRHVCRHFSSQGYRVLGAGHGEASEVAIREAGLSRWHSGDVQRPLLEALAEPIDLIVHCAGSSTVGDTFGDPNMEFRKNVGAAVDVLDFARDQSKRPRVVVLSSAAVYGVVDRLPIGENASLNPISPYGKNKRLIEERCQEAGVEHRLEISIVRLFSVYGRGLQKQLFWDACRKLASGDTLFGGSGSERRDWIHIHDAVRLIDVAARQASVKVPVINGGSGKSLTVSDVLSRIGALWHLSSPITFSGKARPGDPPGYEADVSLARSLGWTPREDFDTQLMDYVWWARRVLGQ